MEPVPSRPQSVLANKGLSQPNRLKWLKPQSGGWIGPDVAKPPGYGLTRYIKRTTK